MVAKVRRFVWTLISQRNKGWKEDNKKKKNKSWFANSYFACVCACVQI